MVNPAVYNCSRTMSFVAIANAIANPIEKMVRMSGCGIVGDSRYFLKEGMPPEQMTKAAMKKVRCCSVSKEILTKETLHRVYQGS